MISVFVFFDLSSQLLIMLHLSTMHTYLHFNILL